MTRPSVVSTHNYGGYRRGCRCDTCKDSARAYELRMRYERRDRLAADPTLRPHGDLVTYHKWMCRCYECYLVHSDKTKEQRERRTGRRRTNRRIFYRSRPFGREWLNDGTTV